MLNEDVEVSILSLLREREFFEYYGNSIDESYFTNPSTAAVFRYIKKYLRLYPDNTMASKRNLRVLVEEEGDERKLIKEVISNLNSTFDRELVIDKISQFVKEGILRSMMRENLQAFEGRKEFNLEKMMEDITKAKEFEILGKTVYDYTAETEQLHRTFSLDGQPVLTGISDLDALLPVPPVTGEEWIIVGPPGRGKTLFMLNILCNAAEAGFVGLYISAGDQGRRRIQARLDSILTDIPYDLFKDPSSRVLGLLRKRVRERVISKGGKIYIQDWSDTSCTSSQVEGLIQSLGGKVNVIAVDYPDIMRPNVYYKERRHEIASIFSDLRRLAVKYNILVWAGSQANRPSLDKLKITMKDVAEDISKCWVADGIVTFGQSEEEKEENMARLYLAKVRRPPLSTYEVNVQINQKTGRIT